MRPLALGLRAPYRLKRTIALLAQATLNLDFTRGGPLDSRVTFPRASGGTSFRPVSYGPELAGLSTAWQSYGTGISLSGGQMVFTASPAGQFAMRGTPLAATKIYYIEFTVPAISGGSLSMLISGGEGVIGISTPGTYRTTAKSNGDDGPYLWVTSGTVTATVTVAICKEITLDRPGDPIQLFTAPATVPRFDYDPVAGRCKGLLVEEQRTNLINYSSDLSGSSWTKSAVTQTPNAALAPDGSASATKISAAVSASSAYHSAYATWNVVTGNAFTYSRFVKAAEYTKVRVADIANGRWSASFDLVSGQVSSTGGSAFVSANMIPLCDGWWRLSLTLNTSLAGTAGLDAVGYPDTGAVLTNWGVMYAGDGVSGVLAWGAQMELGAFPTSYIPTSGAAATRAADTAVVATLAPWYNASAGTLFAEAVNNRVPPSDAVVRFAAALYDTTSYQNAIRLELLSGLWRDVNTVAGVSSAPAGAWTQGVVGKIAAAFGPPGNSASFNGGTPVAAGSSVPTGITKLTIGGNEGGSNMFSGHIRRVAFWPRRMSNLDLQGLTR